MKNRLISIVEASSHRHGLDSNPHVAELRALFAAACQFGLTAAEREEWQSRFDEAIAALETQLTAAAAAAGANARANGWHLRERLMTALPTRTTQPEPAERAV
jgi:hypothetical protein